MHIQSSIFRGSTESVKEKRIRPFSPIGIAFISYAFFIFSTLVPPNIYEMIMDEPNLMFMNPIVHIFVAGCILVFCIGVILANSLPHIKINAKGQCLVGRMFIIFPLLVAVVINAISFMILLTQNPGFLTGWLYDAGSIKQELDAAGGLTEALPLLFSVICWSTWRMLERESFLQYRDWTLRVIIFIAIVFACATAVMKVARYDLLPGIFGIIMVVILQHFHGSSMTMHDFLREIVKISITAVTLFMIFAWLRGSESWFSLLEVFAGYTVASYNRLAALLAGDIKFPYAGSGIYAFGMLSYLPLFHRWWDLGALLGMPSRVDAWLSEFGAIAASGLRPGFIWVTTFGYVYADIGWAVFAYFLVLGMIASMAWRSLKNGRSIGIVFYPWLAFCILLWFSTNFIAFPRTITILITGFLLSCYEFLVQRIRIRCSTKDLHVS